MIAVCVGFFKIQSQLIRQLKGEHFLVTVHAYRTFRLSGHQSVFVNFQVGAQQMVKFQIPYDGLEQVPDRAGYQNQQMPLLFMEMNA